MNTTTAPVINTITPVINMSERAAEKVRVLLAAGEDTAGYGLRVGVDAGGCAGFQYSLALAAEADPGETVVPHDGFDVFVADAVAPLLRGIRIDYVESLTKSGFTFDNPNASDSCGCGTSFSANATAQNAAVDAALRGRVEEALADVRPFLQSEGGDVTVVDVAGGVVSVRLMGACGGCSAATGTLTNVIERRLKEALPEVLRVVQVP